MSAKWRPIVFRLAALLLVLLVAGPIGWFRWNAYRTWQGKPFNQQAWEAAFIERGQKVPPQGPREGYWGARRGSAVTDPIGGWHDHQMFIPKLYDMDRLGLQHAASPCGRYHILIVGGSVAEGTYASEIATTYYERFVRRLEEKGIHVKVSILAGGSWTSTNEVPALARRGLALNPNMVVMMDGLNDMTILRKKSGPERSAYYLNNMRRVCDLVAEHPVKLVFVLQPFLPQKKVKSRIEERILELSCSNVAAVQHQWDDMRRGLQTLAREKGAFFIDTSGVMDSESKTVFADIWHFSDPGHELLGDYLVKELGPLLSREPVVMRGCK